MRFPAIPCESHVHVGQQTKLGEKRIGIGMGIVIDTGIGIINKKTN